MNSREDVDYRLSLAKGFLKEAKEDFLTLGIEEHFMTDYGDESSFRLPWEIFDEEAANSALGAAKRCKSGSEDIIRLVRRWRSNRKN